MPTTRTTAPKARLIASCDAWNRTNEKATVCVTSGPGGYRVFIDSGILADGECEAIYETLGAAMLRMASEAEAAITSQSMFA